MTADDPPPIKLSVLRDIGWKEWDPIGLLAAGESWGGQPFADEYDRYLLGVAGGFRRGMPFEEAVQFLLKVERETIGLSVHPGQVARASKTARSIERYMAELDGRSPGSDTEATKGIALSSEDVRRMKGDPISELQALTEELWARAGMGDCMPIVSKSQYEAEPHVEFAAGSYHIVVMERGREIQRIGWLSAREAARWFLFEMASERGRADEARNRTAPRDAPPLPSGREDDGYSRWNWMAPTIEIMQRISPDMGEWAREKYEEMLRNRPLDDSEKRNSRYPLPPTSG